MSSWYHIALANDGNHADATTDPHLASFFLYIQCFILLPRSIFPRPPLHSCWEQYNIHLPCNSYIFGNHRQLFIMGCTYILHRMIFTVNILSAMTTLDATATRDNENGADALSAHYAQNINDCQVCCLLIRGSMKSWQYNNVQHWYTHYNEGAVQYRISVRNST